MEKARFEDAMRMLSEMDITQLRAAHAELDGQMEAFHGPVYTTNNEMEATVAYCALRHSVDVCLVRRCDGVGGGHAGDTMFARFGHMDAVRLRNQLMQACEDMDNNNNWGD